MDVQRFEMLAVSDAVAQAGRVSGECAPDGDTAATWKQRLSPGFMPSTL
jgi:hypothetical protein